MNRQPVYVAAEGYATLDPARAVIPEPVGLTWEPGDVRMGKVFAICLIDGGEIAVDVPRGIVIGDDATEGGR